MKLSQNFSCIKFVRKYPSYEKILREVKKTMEITLVNTNGKKQCTIKRVLKQCLLKIGNKVVEVGCTQ
jgi:hypothetical protein